MDKKVENNYGTPYKEKTRRKYKKTGKKNDTALIIMPPLVYAAIWIFTLIIDSNNLNMINHFRDDMISLANAHAGVLMILSLVILKFSEKALLPPRIKGFVKYSGPVSFILITVALILSVIHPHSTKPNGLIYFSFLGFALLVVSLIILGIGLNKEKPGEPAGPSENASRQNPGYDEQVNCC